MQPILLTARDVDHRLKLILSENGVEVTNSGSGELEVNGNTPDELKLILPRLLEALTGREISIATLQFLTDKKISSHYQGPAEFEEVVDWQEYIGEVLKSTSIPLAERWVKSEDLPPELSSNVRVLSFELPEIKALLAQVSDWAVEIMAHASDFDDLEPAYQNRLIILAKQYASNIDHVMSFARQSFRERSDSSTVGVTLLRGGKRFEDDFRVDEANRVRVEAKRLDFGQHMYFGFKDWTNLEGLKAFPSMKLAFVDDCGATFGSIESAIISLKQKAELGLVPPIESVSVYLTVATQQGILDFDKHMQELGIKYEMVTGDIAYQLSDLGYIERAPDEPKTNGTTFKADQPYVGDMGFILELAGLDLKAA